MQSSETFEKSNAADHPNHKGLQHPEFSSLLSEKQQSSLTKPTAHDSLPELGFGNSAIAANNQANHSETAMKDTGIFGEISKYFQKAVGTADALAKDGVNTAKDGLDTASDAVTNALNCGVSEKTLDHKEAEKQLHDRELETPITDVTRRALMRDADQYPPVHNATDNSTTYTVVEAGITNRQNETDGANYYSRNVKVTVPDGATNLKDCKFEFDQRQIISEDNYDQLLKRDLSESAKVELHTHGVFTSDKQADSEALLLELSNGLPTINIDWSAHPPGTNKVAELLQYEKDTSAARTATNNKAFVGAIDETIQQVGAQNTDMIGFSHGAMFDARYLAHRVDSHLPQVNEVILAHPDLPIGAPELQVKGKPELLHDAALQSYVIGGQHDNELKEANIIGQIPFTPGHADGDPVERIGDNSKTSRDLIKQEGATPITELDRKHSDTNHFLNFAGIAQLIQENNLSPEQIQSAYDRATVMARPA